MTAHPLNFIPESLPTLGKVLTRIPNAVIKEAIRQNPWFTEFYIKTALEAVIRWMNPDTLHTFLTDFPGPVRSPGKIGIIMAGNVPLVGLHDLLITLLCGHIAVVKPSHQDTILISWLIETWKQIEPRLENLIQITRKPEQIDYLIATGSDNTARYIQYHYKDVPKLIRKNRYSVAVVGEETSESELEELGKDVFLHNGLGCRNVSNILAPKNFDPAKCLDVWKKLEPRSFNPLYLHKVKQIRIFFELQQIPFFDGGYVLVKREKTIDSNPMGVVRFIRFSGMRDIEKALDQRKDDIQCVVGKHVKYGQTQYPSLFDYADGINVSHILSTL